jgi:hypothetical protein
MAQILAEPTQDFGSVQLLFAQVSVPISSSRTATCKNIPPCAVKAGGRSCVYGHLTASDAVSAISLWRALIRKTQLYEGIPHVAQGKFAEVPVCP